MRVEEVGVRALAPASLRTEDPDQVATLRGGPLLEVRDERSDRRHLRERASLGRRPRGPAGDAQRAPHPRRRLPHRGEPVAAEFARDEACDERRDLRRAEALLGLRMAARERQIDLGSREPLEYADGSAFSRARTAEEPASGRGKPGWTPLQASRTPRAPAARGASRGFGCEKGWGARWRVANATRAASISDSARARGAGWCDGSGLTSASRSGATCRSSPSAWKNRRDGETRASVREAPTPRGRHRTGSARLSKSQPRVC